MEVKILHGYMKSASSLVKGQGHGKPTDGRSHVKSAHIVTPRGFEGSLVCSSAERSVGAVVCSRSSMQHPRKDSHCASEGRPIDGSAGKLPLRSPKEDGMDGRSCKQVDVMPVNKLTGSIHGCTTEVQSILSKLVTNHDGRDFTAVQSDYSECQLFFSC